MDMYLERQMLPNDVEIMKVLGDAHLSQEDLCSAIRGLFRTDVQTIEEMEEEIREVNVSNGWYENDRTVGDDIALLHTEVSEMFEAFRRWELRDATVESTDERRMAKPEGFGSECADVFIRLLDTCARRGVNLRAEYERKTAFNRTRGWKHGGKSI